AVHGRVERGLCQGAIDAFENDGIVTHGAADKPALARERRRGTLADHPQVPAVVSFAPRIVVMVVHDIGNIAAGGVPHTLHNPFPPGVGIATGELHRGDVTAPELAILVDDGGWNVDAVLASGCLEIAGRAGVPEPPGAEVHADPDEAIAVDHQVDIVVAGS